jgi:hypothetical protein
MHAQIFPEGKSDTFNSPGSARIVFVRPGRSFWACQATPHCLDGDLPGWLTKGSSGEIAKVAIIFRVCPEDQHQASVRGGAKERHAEPTHNAVIEAAATLAAAILRGAADVPLCRHAGLSGS